MLEKEDDLHEQGGKSDKTEAIFLVVKNRSNFTEDNKQG